MPEFAESKASSRRDAYRLALVYRQVKETEVFKANKAGISAVGWAQGGRRFSLVSPWQGTTVFLCPSYLERRITASSSSPEAIRLCIRGRRL